MKRAVTQLSLAVSTAALAFCATAAKAQATASPNASSQPSPIIQAATRFENNLLSLAEAMPADKFDFAPSRDLFRTGSPAEFATVRTFAQQLTHVCGEPYRLFAPFGVKPDADVDPKSFDSLKSKEDILKALKQSFDYQNKVIASMAPENSFTPAGPRNMTRVSALAAILSDEGDHYGQLVEYLRMNGIVPPATVNQAHGMRTIR
jgi:hypothetical protein